MRYEQVSIVASLTSLPRPVPVAQICGLNTSEYYRIVCIVLEIIFQTIALEPAYTTICTQFLVSILRNGQEIVNRGNWGTLTRCIVCY